MKKLLNLKKSKGFTLIELMIVVAIIGILAAVAVPKFADLISKAKESSVKATVGTVRSALSIYYGDSEGEYPLNIYVALATGNKYMPAISGQNSLGKYEIPKNNNGNSTGHTGGYWSNASEAAGVTIETAYSGAESGDSISHSSGTELVRVRCSHNDSGSRIWSSF